MFEYFMKSIKGTRKMSFNHWRYRLLHWVFCVKDPKNSGLPKFLYTHYCPLFHLTNGLVIFLPLIVAARIVIAAIMFVGSVIATIIHLLGKGLDFVWKFIEPFLPKKPEKPAEETNAELIVETAEKMLARFRQEEVQKIRKRIINSILIEKQRDFNKFWSENGLVRTKLEKESVIIIWEENLEEVLEAERLRDERKKKLAADFAFWINCSRGFFKFVLNLIYVCLASIVAYITFRYGWAALASVIWVIGGIYHFVTTTDWPWLITNVFKYTLIVVGVTLTVAGIVWLISLIRFAFNERNKERIGVCIDVAFMPLDLMGAILGAIRKTIHKMFSNLGEFIGMFYEENCPPIVIVDDLQAEIAEIANVE
jgi:hypothetical protein